jgi:predicted outer membrane protein
MRKSVAGLAIAFGLLAGVAWGQATVGGQATQLQGTQAQGTQAQGTQARQAGQPVQPGQFTEGDRQIAAFVSGKCTEEIQLSQFAGQKAQTDEVREFAQKMAQDHSPGCQLMQQIAGPLAAGGAQAGQAGTQATGQPGGQTGALAGAHSGAVNWNAIHAEISQQCLQSAKQTLSTQQGIDFDKGFMSQQELAHLQMIAALKVVRTQASPQLRQHLDQELQGAEHHLQLAKQIMQQLKDRPSERVSRRTTESK